MPAEICFKFKCHWKANDRGRWWGKKSVNVPAGFTSPLCRRLMVGPLSAAAMESYLKRCQPCVGDSVVCLLRSFFPPTLCCGNLCNPATPQSQITYPPQHQHGHTGGPAGARTEPTMKPAGVPCLEMSFQRGLAASLTPACTRADPDSSAAEQKATGATYTHIPVSAANEAGCLSQPHQAASGALEGLS